MAAAVIESETSRLGKVKWRAGSVQLQPVSQSSGSRDSLATISRIDWPASETGKKEIRYFRQEIKYQHKNKLLKNCHGNSKT